MQYKVPQNVDLPDKVIAFMTLRQFLIILAAGGFVLFMNYVFQGPLRPLFIPVAVVILSIGGSLAFVKISDRPMEVFLLSAAKTVFNPSKRVWIKDTEIDKEKESQVTKRAKKSPVRSPLYRRKKSELQKLASMVDSGLGLAESDRFTSAKPYSTDETKDLHDVIAETEQPSEKIEEMIKKTNKKIVKHKELPVSTMASINTNPDDFRYDHIETASENETKEIVDKAQEGAFWSNK